MTSAETGMDATTHEGEAAGSARILIAVDLGVTSEDLTRAARSLAACLGAEPYLLYAYAFPAPSPSSFYPAASRAIYEQAKLDLRRLARASGGALGDHQLLARSGTPAAVIAEVAAELKVRLIVVGTRRHHGVERLLGGSTAEAVARRAPCPLLVVPSTPSAASSANAKAS